MTEGKVCTKCKEFKSFDDYYTHPTGKDGYLSKCKVCENKRRTKRFEKTCVHCHTTFIGTPKKKWCSENCQEKYRKQQYLDKHIPKPRNFDEEGRKCSNCKEYKTWDNFCKDSSRSTGYETKCKSCKRLEYKPEKNKLQGLAYRKNNPEKERERWYKNSMKRRSYKHKVSFQKHERLDLLERDNWKCQCCGITVHDDKINNETKANVDHVVPISEGGNSEPDNLQILCRTCNLTKGNKNISNEKLFEILLQTC